MAKAGTSLSGSMMNERAILPTEDTATDKVCVLVLGMHRSGTSAITRVFNLLGYALPDRLIGTLEGNEAGHWEPENIVLYNDRLLADMRSSWSDFRTLPLSRLGPTEVTRAEFQIRDLLEREFSGAKQIVLKDPRLCRFVPIYLRALSDLKYRVVPVIAFRNPAEVLDSLQRRRSNWPVGFGDAQAALMWLRHVLDAEVHTRGLPRAFSDYSALMQDWQGEIQRITAQAGLSLLAPMPETAPLVEEFLRPDLHHEIAKARDIAGRATLRGWCLRAHDSLKRLVRDPNSSAAQATLDAVRRDFDAAELILADMSDAGVATVRTALQVNSKLVETSDKQAAHLAQLRTDYAESETTRIAARQRVEGQDGQITELNAELNRMNDLYAQAQATHAAARQRVEGQDGQIAELNAELNRMNDLYAQAQAALDAETGAARHAQMLADTATTAQHRKIAELNAALHNRNLDVDRILLDSRIEMAALTNSHSWRLMAPLRSTMTGMRAIATAFDGFRRASRLKGGMIIGGAIATKILLLEGPRGLRSRLEMVAPAPTAPPAPKLVDPLLCAIVTTPHVMNLAQMMARVLKEEGFSATIRTDLDGASEAGHVFVLCPQMFKNLPDHYVAVQMEQSVSSRWFTPDYFDMLNRARAIIDYSVTNIAFLRVNGLPLYKLFHVPLDADRGLSPAPEAARQGILFFGDDKCPRRQRILAAISAAYPQLRVLNNLFGEALERELRQAAVVLNVHYYENALLETARVYQALSYGTPVVSELSSDQADHAQLDGIVDFAPLDDIEALVRLLRPYADGTDEALARRRKITDFVGRAENTFEIYFRRFLLGQNMIGLDRFESRAADYPMPVSEDPMLCLSLPETPDRRALFRAQAQGQAGFQIWDGLKYTPGWVGAALSYRHMFGRLRKANTRRAVICEDDVLFPPDFDARIAVVDRYLGQHEWDVYSGFIADAHADLRVLKVEDFEGQTFVHIDRAVSMVFNIYNHDIMDYLAEWDPTDRDVYSNTIDRYMEKRNGIRVILSVPFLVGHRPDVISTIWGFENTQYDEVVSKSELLLAEKVAEFRSRRAAAEPAPQPALARS